MIRSSDHFARVHLGEGWKGLVLVSEDGVGAGVGADGLAAPAHQWREWFGSPLSWPQGIDRKSILKTSSTTMVCRISLPRREGGSIDAVFKRGKSRHFRKRLLSSFRTSRPMRTWRRARALLRYGIPTARPLAVLERRRFGVLLDSAFVTEYLNNAVDLESLLTVRLRDLSPGQARILKRQLAPVLAAFILQLASCGFHHRDLKALNVIVQWDPQSADPPRISLVDLDGLKRHWFAGSRCWTRMLMRLNVSVDGFKRVSLTDRLRLLKHFLNLSEQADCWRSVWREIALLSQRKREHRDRQQAKSFKKYGRY